MAYLEGERVAWGYVDWTDKVSLLTSNFLLQVLFRYTRRPDLPERGHDFPCRANQRLASMSGATAAFIRTESRPLPRTFLAAQISKGTSPSAESAHLPHLVELFGLRAPFDRIARFGSRATGLMGAHRVGGSQRRRVRGGRDTFASLRETMLLTWHRLAARHRASGEAAQRLGDASPVPFGERASTINPETDLGHREGWTTQHTDPERLAAVPTPSDVLMASSMRMMLNLAMSLRDSQPHVLGVMCDTMLEVLLEMPPLALAPLCHNPLSIEASTFQRVEAFCAQLMDSPHDAEREHALGIYLALAISRGAVSGMLEVVRCLLDRSREAPSKERWQVGTPLDTAVPADAAPSARSPLGAAAARGTGLYPAGAFPAAPDNSSLQEARLGRVLGRLSGRRADLALTFPGGSSGVEVHVKVSARGARTKRTRPRDAQPAGPPPNGDPAAAPGRLQDMERDHQAGVATDGKFIYAWHHETGAIKAGTGLGGTVKGHVYARNEGAGRMESGLPLAVALSPSDPSLAGGRDRYVEATGDLARRASSEGRLFLEHAGDVGGWEGARTVQPRRLVVHYSWRGLRDVECFSEDEAVDLPTSRLRCEWDQRGQRDGEGEACGSVSRAGPAARLAEGPGAALRVLSAFFLTFDEAVEFVGRLDAGSGSVCRLSDSLRRLVQKYLEGGAPDSPPAGGERSNDGFLAVVGNRAYLQPGGRVPRHRFLVLRTCDLAVGGMVDVPSFLSREGARSLSVSCRTGSPSRAEGESKEEEARREEKVDTPSRSLRAVVDKAAEVCAPHVPLCSDGRLMYALLPLEGSRRPSVVAVDPENAWNVARAAVALQKPRVAGHRKIHATSLRDDELSESSGVEREAGPRGQGAKRNAGDVPAGATADDPGGLSGGAGWPWWQNGGAVPGVGMYSNGDRLIVYWLPEVKSGTVAGTGPGSNESSSSPPPSSSRVEADEAEKVDENSSRGPNGHHPTGGGDDGRGEVSPGAEAGTLVHMARFRLSTGECEAVEHKVVRLGRRQRGNPSMTYDAASNAVVRCSVRPAPAALWPLPAICGRSPREMEVQVCLWRNSGLRPGTVGDGPCSWAGALRLVGAAVDPRFPWTGIQGSLGGGGDPFRDERENQQTTDEYHLPTSAKAAVYVLAHLDRSAEQYLGWAGGDSGVSKARRGFPGTVKDRSVPFCYDTSPGTFRHLVELVRTYGGDPITPPGRQQTRTDSQGRLRAYVLCASLRLLRVNVGILLGTEGGVAGFGGVELRRRLLRCLLELIEGPTGDCLHPAGEPATDEFRSAAAAEAMRLFVDGLDLFYPTPRSQARLLLAYLKALGSRDPVPGPPAREVSLELLCRAASTRFLRGLQADDAVREEGQSPADTECLGPGLPEGLLPSLGGDGLLGVAEALLELAKVQSTDALSVVPGASAAAPEGGFEAGGACAEGGDARSVGQAVLRALSSVLELRCAAVARVAHPTAERGESDPGASAGAGSEREATEAMSRPLLELVAQVLRASDHVLAASASSSLPPAALEVALRGGLVGSLLPSALGAASTLLDEVEHFPHGGACEPETEVLVSRLQEPLVRVVRKLGAVVRRRSSGGRGDGAAERPRLLAEQGTEASAEGGGVETRGEGASPDGSVAGQGPPGSLVRHPPTALSVTPGRVGCCVRAPRSACVVGGGGVTNGRRTGDGYSCCVAFPSHFQVA